MNPRLINGWLVVDCDLPDTAHVEISAGGDFEPAFRDWDGRTRVAKIRPGDRAGRVRVKVRSAGQVREAGVISL